jgi:predicted ATPase
VTRAAVGGPVRTCLVERPALWFGVAVHPSTDVIQEPLGREPILAELATLLASAHGGRGRSLLVLGEAGMGKSTLAEAAATRARAAGFQVARGWCAAAEMPPYWPWWRISRDLALDDPFAAGDAGRVDELDRQLLFAAVVEALDAASRREPLLLVVEDVHWADPASLRLLRTVVDAVPALPVALVITCRDDPGEAAPEVRERLAELPTSVRRVELAGLDRAAVATLVARVAGGPAPVAAGDLWARTGGNPFFVREVVRLLLAQGEAGSPVIPAGVREVLGRRLARLSQACHALLSAAAVIGDPIDEAVVAAVSGRDEAAVLGLLDEAARSRLVVYDPLQPRPFRFAHALVREVPRAA